MLATMTALIAAAIGVSPTLPAASCEVKRIEHSAKGDVPAGADLFLICPDASLWLGASDSYLSAYNPTLDRFLVVNRKDDRERVLLVKPGDRQTALVEDIAADLAQAAGTVVVHPDVSRFAATGAIGLDVPAGDLLTASRAATDAEAVAEAKAVPATRSVRIASVGGMVRVTKAN